MKKPRENCYCPDSELEFSDRINILDIALYCFMISLQNLIMCRRVYEILLDSMTMIYTIFVLIVCNRYFVLRVNNTKWFETRNKAV